MSKKTFTIYAAAIVMLCLTNKQAKAQNFNEVIKAVASDRATDDYFGFSVAIFGNYAIVGSYQEDEDTTSGNTLSDAGSAYIYERDSSGNWDEVQKIVAPDRAAGDNFGYSVAISGNYVVVGAFAEDEDTTDGNTLSAAGSAYIFERDSSGNWNEVQKIVASDRTANDWFGKAVSISGNYLVVGAFIEDEDTTGGNTLSAAGSAYVFERDGSGNWNEVQKIVALDRAANDRFGYSVAISGNYLVVGAYLEDEDTTNGNTLSAAGSAYVFERDSSGNWNETQKIVASDRAINDWFAYSVSISNNYLVVGAYQEDEDTTETNTLSAAGSAYIFERDSSGNWDEVQKIVASDRATNDRFGYSVSISGNHTLVGAYAEDEDATETNSLSAAGSAYVFERDSSGNWDEAQKIVASDRAAVDYFGWAVAISGNNILVGTYQEDEDATETNTLSAAGSAYVFEKCNTTTSTDVQTACDSYTWTDGITYTASNTIATDTFINVTGCDSIVTLNLTINYTVLDSNSAQICTGDSILLGGVYQTLSGSYIDSLLTVSGCDSVVTTTLTVNNTNPTVLANTNDTLICAGEDLLLYGTGAASYIWDNGATDSVSFQPVAGVTVYTVTGMGTNGCTNTASISINAIANSITSITSTRDVSDCLDSISIVAPEATSYVWTLPEAYHNTTKNYIIMKIVDVDVDYIVSAITDEGCSLMDTITVLGNANCDPLAIEEYNNTSFSVYPNPTNDYIHVEINGTSREGVIRIENLLGQVMRTTYLTGNNQTTTIDVSDFDSGIYLIKLSDQTTQLIKKIVVSK